MVATINEASWKDCVIKILYTTCLHHLYFNQHNSFAHGAFLLCTQHCRHVSSFWSGVFNLLKF